MNVKKKIKLIHQRGRLFFDLLQTQRKDILKPVVCDLFITMRCNGRCNYCYTDKTISHSEELTTKQWKEVIDRLYAFGCRMFNLMGGEPLLRDDFLDIFDHILAKNVLCEVNTNCFLVPENTTALRKASQIFTSLDGDEHAHDLNRGKGSYKKTIRGIMAAKEAGIPVRINCTVTRHNTEKIDFLVDFCEKHNLFLTFTPLIRIRDVLQKKATSLYLDDTSAKKAFLYIKNAKKTTNRIMNSDASLDFFIKYPVALDRIVRKDETGDHVHYYCKPCPYGRLQFFIVSNGDVFPCHNMWNETSFRPKNIFKDGMHEALLNAGKLWCKYCWLANLVEWNEFTSLKWLIKGSFMTINQIQIK